VTSTPVAVVSLAVAVLAYGLATGLLSEGAQNTDGPAWRHPAWLTGSALQAVGFLAAFLARHALPLLVVQPAVASSIVVAVVVARVRGRWSLSRRDSAVLMGALLGLGLVSAVSVPGPSRALAAGPLVACAAALALAAIAVVVAHRVDGRTWFVSAVAAGAAFGVSAVAARALAGGATALPSVAGMLHQRSAWATLAIVVVGTVVGQATLTQSLAGGRVVAPMTAMYAVSTVGPAAAGLVWLGDRVHQGLLPIAVLGGSLALICSMLLERHSPEASR